MLINPGPGYLFEMYFCFDFIELKDSHRSTRVRKLVSYSWTSSLMNVAEECVRFITYNKFSMRTSMEIYNWVWT